MKNVLKVILVLSVIVILGLLLVNKPKQVETSLENHESQEVAKSEQVQEPNLSTPQWDQFKTTIAKSLPEKSPEELLDFSVDIKALGNLDQGLVKNSVQKIVSGTLQCLDENQCGFEMPEEGEYYDPSEIPAMKLLKRELEVALAYNIEIPENELLKLTEQPNSIVVERAFALLLKQTTKDQLMPLFKRLEGVSGSAFGPTAKKLLNAAKGDLSRYNELLEAFIKTLEEKDPFTTIEALEAFRGLPMDQSQFEDLGRILCPWRVRADHNWLAAKKNLEEISKEQKLRFDPSSYCP